MTRVLVGIDLTKVADIAESLDRFGDRYLNRLYTADELADCNAKGPTRVASLAARYAAKEALLKALQPAGAEAPEWTTIEVLTKGSGAPRLRLHGAAAALAVARNVRSLTVSLTHEGDYASAVVVALCDGEDAEPPAWDARPR